MSSDGIITGIIANFSSSNIDNDGVPYFEFALTVMPFPPLPVLPTEIVFYTDLRKGFAPSVVVAVTAAWADRTIVDVFPDNSVPQPRRVRGVVPHQER